MRILNGWELEGAPAYPPPLHGSWGGVSEAHRPRSEAYLTGLGTPSVLPAETHQGSNNAPVFKRLRFLHADYMVHWDLELKTIVTGVGTVKLDGFGLVRSCPVAVTPVVHGGSELKFCRLPWQHLLYKVKLTLRTEALISTDCRGWPALRCFFAPGTLASVVVGIDGS